MNKVKKAIAELKSYLGNDSYGQKLLANVSNAANEIRKELAAKTEQCDELAERMQNESLECQLREVQRKSDALRNENQVLHDRLKSTCAKAALLKARIDLYANSKGIGNEDTIESLHTESGIKSLVNSVRKQMKTAPRPYGMTQMTLRGKQLRTAVYRLEQLGSGSDATRFMFIGKFVSILALFNLPCVIVSDTTTVTLFNGMPDSIGRPFMKWYGKNSVDQSGVWRFGPSAQIEHSPASLFLNSKGLDEQK